MEERVLVYVSSTMENFSQLLINGDENNLEILSIRVDNLIFYIENAERYHWFRGILAILVEVQELLLGQRLTGINITIGRPKIIIPQTSLEYLLSMNFKVPIIAKMHNVSTKTIFRRFRECNLSIGSTYSTLGHQDILNAVQNILLRTPNTGYKRMKGYLLRVGIKLTENKVREIMREVDPVGVAERTHLNRAIIRRHYFVRYSNEMWHIDANLKLIRWNIVIRGGIDGKSRTCVFLEASGDNKAETNFLAFMKGVQTYGVPSRTRTDKGKENILIAKYMLETRGVNRGSHICGRSVHNQRIERFWKDVTYGCTSFFKSVFIRLEENGVLNVDNPNHVYILKTIFLPRINHCLKAFAEGWNHHPLSSENNFSPRQLMLLHLPPPQYDMHLTLDEAEDIAFFCDRVDDLLQFQDEEDNLTQPQQNMHTLSPLQMLQLNNLDVLEPTNQYGYEIFQRFLQDANIY